MSSYHGKVDTLGLSFFGSMTASISHEIKNALAVINENAGLLGDLVGLAEKGRPLDPERLKTISVNIRRRVQSADDIVRKLNRFAHSANQPVITTDIREIFEFTIALAERLATMKGVTFSVTPGEVIEVQTLPFVVENLLWICLKNLFLVTTGNQNVELGAQSEGSEIVIFLKFSAEIPVAQIETMVAAEAQPLIFFLRMQINADIQSSQLRLKMPKKFME
ncbi:histidine kinase dimerization/phospho-acceptor domain-containing protein [uncultured Desulfobulbus sp.]|uniref:histidine kinase dimerization/phospho-acceptor domain-containing protein n=1 Tax=uncultured Desulfobulbus sp. TaxID=239745 RepID=UPI0029C8CCC0|nr:histidine kinase dimerization/phospho-acceptor domain-containing protein [uncultured Desulfobulbus sp.]